MPGVRSLRASAARPFCQSRRRDIPASAQYRRDLHAASEFAESGARGAAALTPAPETMGLSAGRPEAEAFAQSRSPSELEAMPSKRPSKPRRDIQPVSASPQRRACIPSYDSSGAQTGTC